MSARLQASRERLRALLIPDEQTGRRESGMFPRSTLMQLIFNARARQLAVALFSLFLMYRGRRAPALHFLPQLTRSISGLIGAIRN